MLISALCDYYDVLAKKGLVLPDGYSGVGIHALIALTEDGAVDSIVDCQETEIYTVKDKPKERKVPKTVMLPKRTEKTAIDANIIEHRPLYIFGLNYDAKTAALSASDGKDKAKKSHDAFVEKNLEFIDGIDTPLVNAYRSFMKTWKPEEQEHNETLLGAGKLLVTGKFAFCLAGRPDKLLHDEPKIKEKWEQMYAASTESDDAQSAQCCITGKYLPIKKVHDKIKGIGGQSMSTLVCCNNEAEESYGKKQSFNSCISATAVKKYTEALNYLLAKGNHRTFIDKTTYIYWAASGDEACDDIFSALSIGDTMDREHTDKWLDSVFKEIKHGKATQEIVDGIDNIDSNVSFYVVGVKPTKSRLAVKCVYRQSFGKILQNTIQHHSDMQLDGDERPITINAIYKALMPTKRDPKSSDDEDKGKAKKRKSKEESSDSNDKVSPALMAKLFDAIINGTAYPDALLATALRRVKTSPDDKMNNVRMGLIKACINRSARLKGKQEEIKMSLDLENRDPAYLCGRLFCKLEDIQRRASNDTLNRTIKDAYFSSAATRPAVVFPKLLSLSQHHLAKLEDKTAYFMDREVTEIIGMMGSVFPSHLTLKEQGVFMLGYYQQKNQRFEKKAAAKAADE